MVFFVFEDYVNNEVDFSWWINNISENNEKIIFSVNKIPTGLNTRIKEIYCPDERVNYAIRSVVGLDTNAVTKKNKCLYDYYQKIINCYRNEISVIMIWGPVKCGSIEAVCRDLNIPFFYFEASPFRKGNYSDNDYVIVQSTPILQVDKEDVAVKYEEFLDNISLFLPRRFFSGIELLFLISKKERISDIFRAYTCPQNSYEYGIATSPSYVSDSSLYSDKWTNDRIIGDLVKKGSRILVRNHPDFQYKIENDNIDIDYSFSSIDFISKCKIIATGATKTSLEALYMDKPVRNYAGCSYWNSYLSETPPQKADNSEIKKFLTFSHFYFLTPMDLLKDEEYLLWRNRDDTSILDVCNKHFAFINTYLKENINYSCNGDFCGEIFNKRCGNDSDKWRRLLLYDNLLSADWENKRIHICGTGKYASLCKIIAEKKGAEVCDFVIAKKYDGFGYFDGLKVESIFDNVYGMDDYFLLSQGNISVLVEVIDALISYGINKKNIYLI